jgi:hypothetical protein
MFRITDAGNYENFYLRQHLSGKNDANQYTPVFNGVWGWQIYTGARYGVPVRYPENGWIHVKLSFSGSRAETEIAGELVPIPELKRDPAAGGVGLFANLSGAHFAGFEVHSGPVTLRSPAPASEAQPPNVIQAWEISTPFAEKAITGKVKLDDAIVGPLHWTKLAVEKNGIANLARVAVLKEGNDTVVARLRVRSDRDRVHEMRFGFSDRVRLYCNGRLLFAGDDSFRTRDDSFLGSVGLHDTVALPLRKGENEIAFVVSETFGGWAVMAEVKGEGVTAVPPE